MRNKEVAATTTLLDNGEQVLLNSSYLQISENYMFHKYYQPDFKVITTLPIQKEVVWKHGTSFPGSQGIIKTPRGLRRFV